MRVLVAPDKFKGSLTAIEVATALAQGLEAAGVASRALPVADGGDGSIAAALAAGYRPHPVTVIGASGRPIDTEIAIDGDTAIVEVANTCGLATVNPGDRRPMDASSYGFGQAVSAALAVGARRIVLALGGSASTDGGAGMLSALGARFYDAAGRDVQPSGGTLGHIAAADLTELADLRGIELLVATDVANPLLGPSGAAAVFGPQKGAAPAQIPLLEDGLRHLVDILHDASGRPSQWADAAGSGAAGGLGFAARWLGATRIPGADFFLDLFGFDAELRECQAVIVGEGNMDAQTLWGKLPAVVAARSAPRPTFAVVGQSSLGSADLRRLNIHALYALTDMTTADPSIDPALSLTLLASAGRRIGHTLHSLDPGSQTA